MHNSQEWQNFHIKCSNFVIWSLWSAKWKYQAISISWYTIELIHNPAMDLSHISQCTIQNRNVHISVLKGALWDMEQIHCRICEVDLFRGNLLAYVFCSAIWVQLNTVPKAPRIPMDSPHKGSVMRKSLRLHDSIMIYSFDSGTFLIVS